MQARSSSGAFYAHWPNPGFRVTSNSDAAFPGNRGIPAPEKSGLQDWPGF